MRFELTTTGATSRCSVQLSYGHIDHDRNRTCVRRACPPSGFVVPHLAIRSRGHKLAGQGSNLPSRRLCLPLSRFGGGRSAIGTSGAWSSLECVGRDLNPHISPKRGRGYGPLHCHSATYASLESQRGRIRSFDPVRPRHVRCQTALHAEKYFMLPEGIKPIIFRMKAGHPDRWTTGAKKPAMLSAGIEPASSP